ncbi:MAG: HEAT repeat domain-containing protein [Tannerellaceae bacterium]|nr:HEAT repeat domain-containing protein [Tannerellaceae bacterium]
MIQVLTELQDKFNRIRQSKNSMDHTNFLLEMIGAFENVRYTIDEKGEYHFHENIDWIPYIEFHYRLMTDKDIPAEAHKNLMFRFKYHEERGGKFLLSKMDNKEDTRFYPDFIFSLGQIYQYKKGEEKDKEKVLDYARTFACSENDKLRENGIIVVGWLGNESDFPLLEDRMLNDPVPEFRAWAGSAFRFLNITNKAAKGLPILKKAIEKESDAFALSTMIQIAQELAKKKWISQQAINDIETEAIQKGKEKALRYLNKR